jgi:hypothetical protein
MNRRTDVVDQRLDLRREICSGTGPGLATWLGLDRQGVDRAIVMRSWTAALTSRCWSIRQAGELRAWRRQVIAVALVDDIDLGGSASAIRRLTSSVSRPSMVTRFWRRQAARTQGAGVAPPFRRLSGNLAAARTGRHGGRGTVNH